MVKDKKRSKDDESNTNPSNATPTGTIRGPGGLPIPILGTVDDSGQIHYGKTPEEVDKNQQS